MKKAASRIIAHLSSGMPTYYDINNQNETKPLISGGTTSQDGMMSRNLIQINSCLRSPGKDIEKY